MRYKMIRTEQQEIVLEVKAGKLTVRAPRKMRKKDVNAYVAENEALIRQKLKEYPKGVKGKLLNEEDFERLIARANEIFPQLVQQYALQLGVKYNRICIHSKKNKWGYCSTRKTLNFNCLLLLMPREVLHSVVLRELCHLKFKHNKKKFKNELSRVCPNYVDYEKWIQQNGKDITRRLPSKIAASQKKPVQVEPAIQPQFEQADQQYMPEFEPEFEPVNQPQVLPQTDTKAKKGKNKKSSQPENVSQEQAKKVALEMEEMLKYQ